MQGDVRDVGSIPGSGRSPGAGHGNPLHCPCLENPMNRGAWGWGVATVRGVAKSQPRLKRLSTHAGRQRPQLRVSQFASVHPRLPVPRPQAQWGRGCAIRGGRHGHGDGPGADRAEVRTAPEGRLLASVRRRAACALPHLIHFSLNRYDAKRSSFMVLVAQLRNLHAFLIPHSSKV